MDFARFGSLRDLLELYAAPGTKAAKNRNFPTDKQVGAWNAGRESVLEVR